MKVASKLAWVGLLAAMGVWIARIGSAPDPDGPGQATGTPTVPARTALAAQAAPGSGHEAPPAPLAPPQQGQPTEPPVASVLPARVLPATDRLWEGPVPEPAFAAFRDWTRLHAAADPNGRTALEGEGIRLAARRREDLKDLIGSDPRRALELAVPLAVRRTLPPSVAELLETRVEGRGDYEVLAGVRDPGGEEGTPILLRRVVLGNVRYQASTYGARLTQPTLFNVPLHGIAVEDSLALAESPIRRLEESERTELGLARPAHVCALDQRVLDAALAGEEVPAIAGGDLIWTCGNAHLEAMNDRLMALALDSDSTDANGAPRSRRAYTEGTKRLIFIRVNFSDLPGIPFSDETGTNLLANLDAFFRNASYNRAGFSPFGTNGSAMTPTLRLPNTAAYYGSRDASEVRNAARAAATAAGFNLNNYAFDLTCFGSVPGFAWAGLGYVGAPGSWIRAAYDTSGGVVAHELGHNFGLYHANFWDTGGNSILGAGSNVEYGDSFDTMGNASAGRRHFNTRYKNYLDWLPNTYVRNALTNGTYRVFAMDSTNDVTSVRALTVRRNSRTNYWVEVRQQWTTSTYVQNGVGIRWGQTGNTTSLLLDMTPGSAEGKNDSPLGLGRTFSDVAAGVHITPLARGGTNPVWFDVAVRFGNAATNRPPQAAVTASAASVAVGAQVRFTATASDPDASDTTLAYAWDFGDGTFGTNGPTASRSFGTAGEYVVRCVVSDLRGGTASDSQLVRVGTPGTVRIAGRVTRDGQPLEGVRIYTSNTKQTFTDSDGTYILAGLARGSYTVRASRDDLLFTRVGFTNPINLQANRADANFEATAPGDLQSLTLIPLGAEWRYSDSGVLPLGGWTSRTFNDSDWSRGAAQLGYGDDDVVTTVSFGPNASSKYVTTWFRHSFVVQDPRAILASTLGIIRDDGAVVYLNGTEVFRSNMPTGTINANTLASASVGGEDESAIFEADLDPTRFVAGTNVIAVEIHQNDVASSDLSFSLQLTALQQPIKDPSITPSVDGGQLRLSWPLAASGFVPVQATSAVGPWSDVDEPVQSAGGQNQVVVPLTADARFYRLERR